MAHTDRVLKQARRDRDERDDDENDDAVDLQELETGLKIDQHALDEALERQPDLFYRVSKQLAILTSRRDEAKQNISLVEADVELEVRRNATKSDDKVTEKSVASTVRLTPKMQRAHQNFLKFNSAVMQLTALKEGYQQRSYVLKSLIDLYVANYYGSNIDGGGSRSRMRDVDAEQSRRVQARMRRGERD